MADNRWVRAATLDRIGDLLDDTAGVRLPDLAPFTTLLVWTMNSLYRVVITEWPEVYIQGGAFFPDPTSAYFEGASIGGSSLRVGWIGVGLLVEIRSGGRHIITSPVRAITTELTTLCPPTLPWRFSFTGVPSSSILVFCWSRSPVT